MLNFSPRTFCFFAAFAPSGRGSAWLERLVRDQEAGGSNPLAPTNLFNDLPRASGLSFSPL